VSEDAAPERTAVNWSPEARADLRAIDRETAIQILHCVDRYLSNRTGDVKKLKPPESTGTSRWSSPESKSPLAKSFVLLEAARN